MLVGTDQRKINNYININNQRNIIIMAKLFWNISLSKIAAACIIRWNPTIYYCIMYYYNNL